MDERNITFMFYGLSVAWGLLCLYVISLAARERNLRRQLENLRKMVESRELERPK